MILRKWNSEYFSTTMGTADPGKHAHAIKYSVSVHTGSEHSFLFASWIVNPHAPSWRYIFLNSPEPVATIRFWRTLALPQKQFRSSLKLSDEFRCKEISMQIESVALSTHTILVNGIRMWGRVDLGGVRGKAGLEYGQITLCHILNYANSFESILATKDY